MAQPIPRKEDLKPISEAVCMFVDHGLFISQALRLAQDFKKVYVYTPWETAFPRLTSQVGLGYDELELVDSIFGPWFDSIDVFVFPDINSGHLQQYLVDQGKAVWGCRLGECLELEREGCKEILKALDLPVGKYTHIKGMENLRTFLQEHDGQKHWVKINKWRGTFETFCCEHYKDIEPKLDEVDHKLGPLKYVIEFTVEEDLPDKVEVGTDGFVIDGKQPSQLMAGIEVKDLCYVGKFLKYNDLPEPVRRFNDRMEPVFAAYGYRGWMSSEVRIGKDHVGHMIDGCMRSPSPPNELWQLVYSNFSEIIYYGAHGIMVDPEPTAKYGAEVLIHSSWASGNWQPVNIEPEVREFVKLRNSMKINGREYISPMGDGLPEIGAVVGLSNESIEDAIEEAFKNAEGVSGYYLDIPKASTETALEQIAKLDELGLNYFKD
jgi:hypothetical protein